MSVSVLLPQPGTRDPSIPRSPGVSSSTGFLVLSRFRRFYHEGFASGLANISWVSGRRPQLCIRNRQFRGNIIPKSRCSFIFSTSSSLKLLERWVPVAAAVWPRRCDKATQRGRVWRDFSAEVGEKVGGCEGGLLRNANLINKWNLLFNLQRQETNL